MRAHASNSRSGLDAQGSRFLLQMTLNYRVYKQAYSFIVGFLKSDYRKKMSDFFQVSEKIKLESFGCLFWFMTVIILSLHRYRCNAK